MRPGVKGTFDIDARRPAPPSPPPPQPREHDQIGQRHLFSTARGGVELRLDAFELAQNLRQLGRVVHLPVLLGARRMRAPLAPPRLSEPRNVEAEAQAVATSCLTDSPDARTFA